MKKAWYLGHDEGDVGASALLVGDPDRIDRIARKFQTPNFLPVKRGLRTVTGSFNGSKVTAVSFGMGAPIATIVLEELADLGVKTFMRIGTAMYYPPAKAGDFILSREILSFEGTSRSYVENVNAQTADEVLNAHAERIMAGRGISPRAGLFATFDAFYREMFPLAPDAVALVEGRSAELVQSGVIAADMETSALVNAAYRIGVRFTSLCVATVDGLTREKLDGHRMKEREQAMFEVALDAITQPAIVNQD